jgi:hypothetical protein
MLEALRLARHEEPGFDPTKIKGKLDEFTRQPLRYVKRDNYRINIMRGRHKISKYPVHGYTVIEHRDEYDTRDGSNRKILVPSDETTVIIVAKYYDQGNEIGRNLRMSDQRPVNSILDTIKDSLVTKYPDEDL